MTSRAESYGPRPDARSRWPSECEFASFRRLEAARIHGDRALGKHPFAANFDDPVDVRSHVGEFWWLPGVSVVPMQVATAAHGTVRLFLKMQAAVPMAAIATAATAGIGALELEQLCSAPRCGRRLRRCEGCPARRSTLRNPLRRPRRCTGYSSRIGSGSRRNLQPKARWRCSCVISLRCRHWCCASMPHGWLIAQPLLMSSRTESWIRAS